MNWLAFVLIGHSANALVFLIDKFFLTKTKVFKDPRLYAFLVALFSLVSFAVLAPFNLHYVGLSAALINIISGGFFIAAIVFFFKCLQGAEASRIVPFIGGGIPIVTLVVSYFFLGERLTSGQLIAFIFLSLGIILISISRVKVAIPARLFGQAALAILFFALSSVLAKKAFMTDSYLNAFLWQRLGGALTAIYFIAQSSLRQDISKAFKLIFSKIGLVYWGNQVLAAIGFLSINYATSLASVSLVNALQGVQYAILFILAILASIFYPKILKESIEKGTLILKSAAIIVIGLGLFLLIK